MSFLTDAVTGFGVFGGGGNNSAAAAQRAENQRQGRVNAASNYINSIFQGGSAPFYSQVQPSATYDPSLSYYMQNNKGGFVPPTKNQLKTGYSRVPLGTTLDSNGQYWQKAGGKFVGVTDPSQLNSLLQSGKLFSNGLKNTTNLYTMTQNTFPGYTDANTYNPLKQSYVDYAMPQYQSQLGTAQRQMLGALSDRGTLNSSVAKDQANSLSQQAALQGQSIVDTGQQYANALKQNMSGVQSSLLQQALASSDPASAASSALQTAANFSAPPAFQPLGQLFSTLANQYGASVVANAPQAAPYYYNAPGYNPYSLPTSYIPGNS